MAGPHFKMGHLPIKQAFDLRQFFRAQSASSLHGVFSLFFHVCCSFRLHFSNFVFLKKIYILYT